MQFVSLKSVICHMFARAVNTGSSGIMVGKVSTY